MKKSDNRKGVSNSSTLILEDVLHIPTSCCNILGAPIIHHYKVELCSGKDGLYNKTTGGRICIFDQPLGKLWRLRLKGQSATETVFDKESVYWIHATWPKSEGARWHRLKGKMLHDVNDLGSTVQAQKTEGTPADRLLTELSKMELTKDNPKNPPYTQEEKDWLKKHFDGEFRFLRAYGLTIYEEEERAEGRQILRALMEGDLGDENSTRSEKVRGRQRLTSKDVGSAEQDEQGDDRKRGSMRQDEEDEPEEENKFLRNLQEHPESHAADYHFSEAELEWIEKHYGYSSNFLMTFGLKFYDDGDCQEGKRIVQQSMHA